MRTVHRRVGAAFGLVALLLLPACGGGGEDAGDPGTITVWTADTLPDRVAATQAIIDRFTQQTGVRVELVGVEEDQFNQTLTASAAAGDLPDVIGSIPLSSVRTLAANDLVNSEATAAVVDALGPQTWNPTALELTREGEEQLAVPSEAWSQLLYYRRDLFDAAGLPAPTSYDAILAAAQALDSEQMAGFVGATAPGDAFTQQTFEHIALANGCQMVDQAGEITIDSPQCVAAFDFYRRLITEHSVPGLQDVDTVRAAYFAGQSAMAVWSTFLLDELAGLRNDAMPSCPECASDPTFLARNTAIVTGLQGPDGTEPAQFGEVISWAITADAATEPAQQFVQFMLSDGYVDWLAFAPEGKFPARTGSTPGATDYVDTWETLPVGVDTEGPLSQFYPQDVLDALATGPEDFTRWGITQGQGDLIGASLGELPVPAAVAEVTSGGTDAQGAAQQAADALRAIQDSLR
ncbi:ABC transporter substrate-binding protein [Pseudonocardia sichuanensis]|uniref:Multiple sugar transport system substrate-binding protein n=1 Tax=Pseudonocardia kunmingensis TaxID=630975 RepID=A0A543E1W0_9PSEU|nr:extracellular solute-binding protein [Pseudonocardia kunmingensis]TQM15560.1 multiple sugar transport system substrate-binding protein [Pseudonocardia kunmingensis]